MLHPDDFKNELEQFVRSRGWNVSSMLTILPTSQLVDEEKMAMED